MLRLRPATNSDAPQITQLVFDSLAEFALQADPGGTDADLADIEQSYLAPGGMFDVLVNDAGGIVGAIGLLPVSPTTCELRKMYLAPQVRGRGWGRRLLDHALVRAAERGFTRVELETASVLKAAVALYERTGFQPFTPDHLAARADRAYYLELPPSPAAARPAT